MTFLAFSFIMTSQVFSFVMTSQVFGLVWLLRYSVLSWLLRYSALSWLLRYSIDLVMTSSVFGLAMTYQLARNKEKIAWWVRSWEPLTRRALTCESSFPWELPLHEVPWPCLYRCRARIHYNWRCKSRDDTAPSLWAITFLFMSYNYPFFSMFLLIAKL